MGLDHISLPPPALRGAGLRGEGVDGTNTSGVDTNSDCSIPVLMRYPTLVALSTIALSLILINICAVNDNVEE